MLKSVWCTVIAGGVIFVMGTSFAMKPAEQGCPLLGSPMTWLKKQAVKMRYDELLYAHRCECHDDEIAHVIRDADALGTTGELLVRVHEASKCTLLMHCILSNDCRLYHQCKRLQVDMILEAAMRVRMIEPLMLMTERSGDTVFNQALYAQCWETFILLLTVAHLTGTLERVLARSMNVRRYNHFMNFLTVDWKDLLEANAHKVWKVLKILYNALGPVQFALYQKSFLLYAQDVDNRVEPAIIEVLKSFEA